MNFLKVFFVAAVLLVLIVLAGFSYLAFSDVPIDQKDVVKEIPYESLQHAN